MLDLNKKKLLLIFLGLIILYSVWLSIGLFSFKTYTGAEREKYPLEAEGAYHLHTQFSDGRKSIDDIVEIAAQEDLDFIILTDHGSPNLESYKSQGWKEGVLVLAGSELSVSRGHLVALGFDRPSQNFSPTAEHAVYEIERERGFSIIAHPYSKTIWSWGEYVGYSGIEIMNADSMLRKDLWISLPYLPALLFNSKYVLLQMLDNPKRNLWKWDELNRDHRVNSYFSTDAHLFYKPLLDLFHLHLLLQAPLSEDFSTAKDQVYEALRNGKFYNSIHAAAHGKGFRFWAEKGKEKISMGSITSTDSPVTFHIQAPFSFKTEARLIRNGEIISRSSDEAFSSTASQPGTYRVEVFLKERTPLGKNIPWIVSNPIFLKEASK